MNTVIDMSKVNDRKEVAIPQADPLLAIIERAARDPSVDIVKMRELLAIRKELAMESAERAFNWAMNAAQAEMRPIAADANNPQTRSRYASYAQLDKALRPIYTKHGFAISYDEVDCPKPDYVRVVGYVSHSGGFTRTYRADMPADGKGAKGGDVMTKTHAAGAAKSYGKRYILKDVWNVAVGEDDTDGNAPKEVAPAPDGYESWKADMTALADEGTDALQGAWKKSSGMRGYAATFDAAWWASTKNKAARASKGSAK